MILNFRLSTPKKSGIRSMVGSIHDRDMLFTYAGLRQVTDKYLVQDRSSGELYETPQYMYMLISATIFAGYDVNTRMDYVRRYYNAISKHKINIPTPIMAGVRTPLRQFAAVFLLMLMTPSILSLVLICLLADTLHKGNRYQRRSNPRHQR